VTNNYSSMVFAFDGMRKALLTEFDRVLVFDLKGNVRKEFDARRPYRSVKNIPCSDWGRWLE